MILKNLMILKNYWYKETKPFGKTLILDSQNKLKTIHTQYFGNLKNDLNFE